MFRVHVCVYMRVRVHVNVYVCLYVCSWMDRIPAYRLVFIYHANHGTCG